MRVQITVQELNDIAGGTCSGATGNKIMDICKIGIASAMETGLGKGCNWHDYAGEAYLYIYKQAQRLLQADQNKYTDEARGSSLVMAACNHLLNYFNYNCDDAATNKLHRKCISHYSECNDLELSEDIEDTGKNVWDMLYEVNQLPKDRERVAKRKARQEERDLRSKGEPLF